MLAHLKTEEAEKSGFLAALTVETVETVETEDLKKLLTDYVTT